MKKFRLTKQEKKQVKKLPKIEQILVKKFLEKSHELNYLLNTQSIKVKNMVDTLYAKQHNGIDIDKSEIIAMEYESNIATKMYQNLVDHHDLNVKVA